MKKIEVKKMGKKAVGVMAAVLVCAAEHTRHTVILPKRRK